MNIVKKLESMGVEITPEINKAFDGDWLSELEVEKRVSKLETTVEELTTRAETAEKTLKGFEGKDFDEITKDRDKWKSDYENLIKSQEEAKENAEFEESVMNAIKEAKGKNAKAIIAQLDMDALKTSKNRDKDIANAIKALSDEEDTAFLFNTDAEDNSAKITAPVGGQPPKADIHEADLRAAFGLPAKE